MTDKEKLVALLTEFGVGFELHGDGTEVVCREGAKEVAGYSQFFTVFDFDPTGKFAGMGAYE